MAGQEHRSAAATRPDCTSRGRDRFSHLRRRPHPGGEAAATPPSPELQERSWSGAGFEEPFYGVRVTADDPSTFTATLRWLQLDRVEVQMIRAEPHRFSASESAIAQTERRITIFALGDGEIDVTTPEGAVTMRRGDCAISGGTRDVVWHARTPLRMLFGVVRKADLPEHLVPSASYPEVLERTPLVNGFIAFLSSLLTSRDTAVRTAETSQFLERTLIDLHLGVLTERRRPIAATDRDALRRRMEDYVQLRLGDPELDPQRIADAAGISLRYAHLLFSRDGETLAAFVRNRRLEAVALELRGSQERLRTTELAARAGFASSDALSRAFRRRYGVTMGEYRLSDPAPDPLP